MLDPDISTADARRLLSVQDDDPSGWSRRQFLTAVGWGVGGGVLFGSLGELVAPGLLPGGLRDAWAAEPVADDEGILISIVMYGGNDGLNTVVPFADSNYQTQHGRLAIGAAQALALNASVGLNPELTELKTRWDAGQLAVIQGVGYPNPDLSHFNSMAKWMYGRAGSGVPTSGWVGRWLDGLPGGADLFRAATIGSSVPLHMVGEQRRATAVPPWGVGFGGDTDPADARMYSGLRNYSAAASGRGQWHDTVASTVRNQLDVAATVAPVFAAALPDSEIVRKLVVAARLVNANLGLRVIDVGWGDFDSHANQPYQHTERMRELNDGIRQFFAALDGRWHGQVALMTTSEFGRTSYRNDSNGTDHGTAAPHFVIGRNVKGGLYGMQPSLAGLRRWDRMAHHVDFRSMYRSVIDGWLGGGGSTVLGGEFEDLGLFSQPPGGGGSGPPSTGPGGFVPLTPARVLDTKTGVGVGTAARMTTRGTISFPVGGLGGVPAAGVTAVLLDVTATEASAQTRLTWFPAGQAQPNTVQLWPARSTTLSNLVVVPLGELGAVSVYNATGRVHARADVVGDFGSGIGTTLAPLAPARLLDTRTGLGAAKAKLGPSGTVDLQVTGQAGVPADASAVVLQVGSTRSTANSTLTVWPKGAPRPSTASVDVMKTRAVSNLVVCPIGTGGMVSVYNGSGSTDVSVDVVGCFVGTALARHVSIPPARLLDSAAGIGMPPAAIGTASRRVVVAGAGGVPVDAEAVVLNMVLVGPSTVTDLTAWPAGQPRPTMPHVSTKAGTTLAGTAIVPIGQDGSIDLSLRTGTGHVIVDAVGYFVA